MLREFASRPQRGDPGEGADVTPEQIALVQTSWKRLAPIREQAAGLLCARIEELDPGIGALFRQAPGALSAPRVTVPRPPCSVQSALHGFGGLVHQLHEPAAWMPLARELGRQYRAIGLRSGHYATVAVALLWTLEKALGPDFTPALRDAWTASYMEIASCLKDAALASA